MERYEKYKPSGIEWIGEIPEHWEVKKFKSISYMKGRIGWQNLRASEFTQDPNDPFVITGMNFKGGIINWNEVYHFSEERYLEAPEIQLKVGDILMTKDGTIGKLLYINFLPGRTSLNSHLLVFRPLNNSYQPTYLYYQLDSLIFKLHIEVTKTGTTFYGISQESVGEFKTILPAQDEQVSIVAYLDRKTAEIDQIIVNKQKLIALYEDEKQAVINHSVTRGVNPNVRLKPSGVKWLGDIPEHWEVKKLKNLADLKSGDGITSESIKESGEYPVYGGNGFRGYFDSFTHEGSFVLIGRQGALCGNINYGSGRFWASEHAIVCALKDEYNTKWFGELLRTMNLNQYSVAAAQPGLSVENLKVLQIPVPPISEQQTIVRHIEKESNRLDIIIEKCKKQIELLKEYRTTLISEVVTGKIKVSKC